MWQLSSTNLMSCCYSAFELLLLGTWSSACYQRVDVLSQLLQTATLRLSYCLVRGHMLPTTAWGRFLAATRPSTLRLSYCLVNGHLLATSAWTFSRSYYSTAPCMSGSGIINHPLRDEPGLKTKKSIIIPASTAVLPRTFVKALGATFV